MHRLILFNEKILLLHHCSQKHGFSEARLLIITILAPAASRTSWPEASSTLPAPDLRRRKQV
jgi:hypothetical protein